MKYFIYTVIAVVLAAIVTGFIIAGSPQEERLRRFDQERLNALQIIQSEIISYWTNKNKLPEQLTLLEDSIRGFRVPVDPQTGASYIYTINGPLSFTLCATFNLPSQELMEPQRGMPKAMPYPYGGYMNDNWTHQEGDTCFDRVIDPDIYRPIQK